MRAGVSIRDCGSISPSPTSSSITPMRRSASSPEISRIGARTRPTCSCARRCRPCRCRTHLPIGNHDHRERFLAAFPGTPADGFVQSAFDTEAGRFVLLDTNEPGVSWGVICARRLAWLGRQLDRAAADDRPIYLFMHHPPFPVGLKRMDEISLREPESFAELVRPHARHIRHHFFGHLHRPIAGSWPGIPVSTMRGTNHQVALDFVTAGVVPGSHEPPEYAVVLARKDCMVVHLHNYLDRTATFTL